MLTTTEHFLSLVENNKTGAFDNSNRNTDEIRLILNSINYLEDENMYNEAINIINGRNEGGDNALFMTCNNNDMDMLELLLDSNLIKYNSNLLNIVCGTLKLVTVKHIIELLVTKYKLDINNEYYSMSPLFSLIIKDFINRDDVIYAIKLGANIITDNNGMFSPLANLEDRILNIEDNIPNTNRNSIAFLKKLYTEISSYIDDNELREFHRLKILIH